MALLRSSLHSELRKGQGLTILNVKTCPSVALYEAKSEGGEEVLPVRYYHREHNLKIRKSGVELRTKALNTLSARPST